MQIHSVGYFLSVLIPMLTWVPGVCNQFKIKPVCQDIGLS